MVGEVCLGFFFFFFFFFSFFLGVGDVNGVEMDAFLGRGCWCFLTVMI